MFVRIYTLDEGTGIMFSREGRLLPVVGETDVSAREIRFGQFNTPAIQEFNRRVSFGEPIWIENEFTPELMAGPEMNFIRNNAHIGQIRSLKLTADAYSATPREMALAIHEADEADLEAADGIVSFDAPLSIKAQSSALAFSRMILDYDTAMSLWRSLALAWMTDRLDGLNYHYLQVMGYDPDTSRHMDPSYEHRDVGHGFDRNAPFRSCESLVTHVNLACQCALDTPQPVTVTVGTESETYALTFRNKRVSGLIRGLEITLPTGGVVFIRDAYLRDGTVYKDNAWFPKRSITARIVERLADDCRWFSAVSPLGVVPPAAVTACLRVRNAPDSPAFGGSGPAHG